MTPRDVALAIAERLLFHPYLWGGDDPMAGFDCSGFVIEVLKSAGVLPRDGDWTAEGLRQRFLDAARTTLQPGDLVFWPNATKTTAIHVEMVWRVLGPTAFTIGSSGGGSKTNTLHDAIRQNAYIKVRPVRAGWFYAVDPFGI